ncbi:MAG: response regulator [Deltaproteobacteria bacterium]|nr:response regulator [Deltaproteobacteria bacterium]
MTAAVMTLRAKASILITVIISITIGTIGIFHVAFFETSLKDSIFKGLETISNASSQLISRFLEDTLVDVDAIAHSLPKKALEQRDVSLIEEMLRTYSQKFTKFENGMFILDEKGLLWADFPVHPEVRGKSFAFREYFQRTMREKRGITGTPYRSARTGEPVLTFTAPLTSSSGDIIGLLACSVQLTSPKALEGIRLTRIGKTGYIYVYNKDRLMILHPQDERILKKDVPPGVNRLFDAALEGFEGVGETVNSRGKAMFLSLRNIPGTDWILGAQQPREEAFSPVEEAKSQILASILLAVFLAVIVAAVTITGITRPLSKLRKAVMLLGAAGETREALREQQAEYRKELEGIADGGEIGDLTRAFLGISEQLDMSMRSLKSSARDWERTFDSVSDLIAILDEDGRIIRMNYSAKTVLQAEVSDGIGRPVADIFKEAKIISNLIGNNGKSGSEQAFIMALDGPGTHHILEVTMSPLLEESERRTGTVAVAKDITSSVKAEEEKKRLEAQLQQAQKMEAIGTLAGGIAHNFNNLLMGIQGNASLILLDTDREHPHHQRAVNIEKLVQSGSRLTSQLLGYAREGRFRVNPLSLNQLVKETSNTFAMARKDIRVQLDLEEDLFAVLADRGQIEQVLMNLFVNAADAMADGGALFLKTRRVTHKDFSGKAYEVKPGDYVLLTVRDTGTGMDRKTLDRIFDPFFTTKGVGKGTGLGLASVYGIVKAHEGYINVESEVGRGAAFHIYLPACREAVEKDNDSPSQLAKGNEKVLLVDDEEMILEIGQQILTAMGYSVSLAKSGNEALEIYRSEWDGIDLVLLDLIMPDMCGGDTYDHLKQINPEVKVLLASGFSIDGRATEILKRGCNGFIQKPFNIEQLSYKIREILNRSSASALS